ncbi:MAG: hypothetical protein EP343_26200 [Deltaproteobacteria bacterium]|nr:MAG: hypothetical protein EP343_26200 [Deltaproteobacteria bacterium]
MTQGVAAELELVTFGLGAIFQGTVHHFHRLVEMNGVNQTGFDLVLGVVFGGWDASTSHTPDPKAQKHSSQHCKMTDMGEAIGLALSHTILLGDGEEQKGLSHEGPGSDDATPCSEGSTPKTPPGPIFFNLF